MTIETVLSKTAFEERYFDFDFTADLDVGETIEVSPAPVITVTPTTSPALTFDPATISGGRVQSKFKAGLAGTTYDVSCRITTNTQKREACGDLYVEAC